MHHAFISDGKLFIHDDDGTLTEIASKFAREKAEGAERQKSLHSWKAKGKQENLYFGADVVWGNQVAIRPYTKFRFKTVMVEDSDTLYYLLTNNNITGLFKNSIKNDEELRLFHKNDFVELGIDYSIDSNQFIAAILKEDRSANLELLNSEGQHTQTITGGDSKDSNPTFSRHNSQEILYQTAGIARSDDGFIIAYSPESISKINLETGEISELLSDNRYDYLLPKDDSAGNLYCIRRPYRQPGYESPLKTLLYVITFPFRLLVAIVLFLNAFTKLFAGKPPQPAGPYVKPNIENKYIQVLGQAINLAKIQKSAKSSDGPSLVPGSWELVKFSKDGQVEVIAKKVSSFDIDEDGSIHFTNGFRVNEFSNNSTTTLFKYRIIENIKVAKAAN